jgi:V/A-type H+-transporting ATPase subunit A
MATKGTVCGVISNMVTLTVDGPVAQNEICYISTGGDRLMGEVIKVVGVNAYVQVFESTRGLKVGSEAEFTGHMLEVTLGRVCFLKTTMVYRMTSIKWMVFS